MVVPKILVVWSNYYPNLAKQHLDACTDYLQYSKAAFDIEIVNAGTYEIPAVMQFYEHNKPYAGYLPLGLLLQGATDHYDFIFQHIKECFIQFALKGTLLGNGIISAASMDILTARVENKERVIEACKALEYLISLKEKLR